MSAARPKRLFWLADANSAHTQRWLSALAQCGHQILLFSLTEPKPSVLTQSANVRIESARLSASLTYSSEGGLRKLTYAKSVPTVRSLARRFAADLHHAHYASSYGVLAMLAGLRRRVLSIWGADVFNTPNRSFVHRLVVASAMNSADLVLSTSRMMREQGRRLSRRDIHVVPFGIDMVRFSPTREPATGQEFTIGTVKSLEDKYGIDVLLQAFALVLGELPDLDLRLLVFGDGSRRDNLVALAEQLQIARRVRFAGAVEYSRVPEAHNLLDIAVFPSIEDSESFGVSVVEAQACARPVIVSRVGGLPEVVRERDTALIVPPRNSQALARGMRELICNPERAREMGRAGREHVLQHYDLVRCVELLESHYDRLIAAT